MGRHPRRMTLCVRQQEATIDKLTPEETLREHNRGQKAARDGRSQTPWHARTVLGQPHPQLEVKRVAHRW